ncbi:hypothetical protein EAO74_02325 [Streptomyces sp. gb1(2016)]|uniref:Uncharacterized protein n=1 Tax=Streptomyces sp. gb1(2016) TaxID=1828321 RepID=A0A652LDE9_9ACTN|nr:hypothetical protein EAO74_02325 [Streptomyces sp. gb1(2016)]
MCRCVSTSLLPGGRWVGSSGSTSPPLFRTHVFRPSPGSRSRAAAERCAVHGPLRRKRRATSGCWPKRRRPRYRAPVGAQEP